MTRGRYIGCVEDRREAEVLRLFDRYLVEVVEEYGLCPWARPARLNGELAVKILFGEPEIAQWIESSKELLARPGVLVAMVIAPEMRGPLRPIREQITVAVPGAGVADFYPEAPLDMTTPARLVPYLRRAPDPFLQLVPLALLQAVRAAPPVADRALQVEMLGGRAQPLRGDLADTIAAANHARVSIDPAAFSARLASLAADRARSYPRAGIKI
jgi:hypothetical protein